MKRIAYLVFSILLLVAVGTTSNSCAPTNPPTEQDTTKLISVSVGSFTGTLTRKDSTGAFTAGLTCGCPFVFTIIGYGGDTSVIHFINNNKDSSQSISTHTISSIIYPSSLPAGPSTTNAWVILMTLHDKTDSNPGTPLYDTIRVTAIY